MDQEPTRLGVNDVDLADWRWLLATLRADFAVGSLGEGAEFVRHLTGLVDEVQTRADVRLTADRVVVSLQGAASATVTERESAMAEQISAVAAGRGLVAAPQRLQLLELALDTPADAAVRPFWAAVLGAEVDGDDVVDPAGVLPPLWFQDTDSTAPDRQRFHLDITVPPEVAEERIAAAVDAGGTVRSQLRAGVHRAGRRGRQSGLYLHRSGTGLTPGATWDGTFEMVSTSSIRRTPRASRDAPQPDAVGPAPARSRGDAFRSRPD